jgi:hypothetical protein
MKTNKLLTIIFLLLSVSISIKSQKIYNINASAVMQEPLKGIFKMGDPGPDKNAILVNSLYITIGSKPVLPVMGEMQFSRVRADQWEDCILKMKACGINIISTYLFWNQHEEIEGEFNWAGEKDLRAFIKLCQKHDMYVIVRMGPWSHGEARNGGTPDWILKKKFIKDRSNDIVYQNYVERYFTEVASQLYGLNYKDGGNIIGIQLENEYWFGKKGEDHIKWLKETTKKAGIDVPVYTVTGWGNGSVPPFEVIPMWGAYADAPWVENVEKVYQPENYMFDPFRDNKNIGNDRVKSPDFYMSYEKYPYFTCEIGVGVQNTYHRRLVIGPVDGLGMMTAKLGSGSNLLGYYIFAGATQSHGLLHSTGEEQEETGYWSLVPGKSYDFQAAIRESGELSPAYKEVKKLNYFANTAGEMLAPMMPVLYKSSKDEMQIAVRSDNKSGFIFGINYARYIPKATAADCRFQVKFKDETILFPKHGIYIPDSTIFIWPLNYNLDGAILKYATAQLLGKTGNAYIFFENKNIPVEMAFDRSAISNISPANGTITEQNNTAIISDLKPGKDCIITLTLKDGSLRYLFVLTEKQADDCWLIDYKGKKECYISNSGITSDEHGVYVSSTDTTIVVSHLNGGEKMAFDDIQYSTSDNNAINISPAPHPLLSEAKWLETANFKDIQPYQQRYHRFFFKEFSLTDPARLKSAILYIYPESDCRLNLNNSWVQQQIKPGALNAIDLTGYIVNGENILYVDFPFTTGQKRFASRLIVEYYNYNRLEINSDQSWLYADLYVNPSPMKQNEQLSPPTVVDKPAFADTITSGLFNEYDISIPHDCLENKNNIYLKMHYSGDRAELYNGYMLSADNFNDNALWSVGLNRQEQNTVGKTLRLVIYKLSKETKIFFDIPPEENSYNKSEINSFTVVPEYKFKIE